MKEFFLNIWVKRSVSVFCIVYAAVIALLAYATFLYNLEFAEGMETPFFIIYTLASAIFLTLMLITRKQRITCIIGMILPFIVFLLILKIFQLLSDRNIKWISIAMLIVILLGIIVYAICYL